MRGEIVLQISNPVVSPTSKSAECPIMLTPLKLSNKGAGTFQSPKLMFRRGTGISPLRLAWKIRPLLWIAVMCVGIHGIHAENWVTRQLPETAIPGSTVVLSLTVSADEEVGVYAVEEKLPETWTANEISHFGRFDSANGKIKWGPFLDRQPRIMTAQVQIPPDAEGFIGFSGISSFNGASVPITGPQGINILNASEANRVEASLPAFFQPSIPFGASYDAQPSNNVKVYAIEDRLPAGWQADTISHGGRFDGETGKIKWGPFLDNQQRTLTAMFHPSDEAVLQGTFEGTGSFDGVAVPIKGQRTIHRIQSNVFRGLPTEFQRRTSFQVNLQANVHASVRIYAVEDILPTGWTASSVNEGGFYDAETGKVKWGPFEDAVDRTFQYLATPSLNPPNQATFSGYASFDGFSTLILGDSIAHAKASQAIRNLPETFLPDAHFDLVIQVFPDDATQIVAVEETIPTDWIVSSLNEGGMVDTTNHKIKWGPFADNQTRILTVELLPPSGAIGVFSFSGTVSFDGTEAVVGGPFQTEGLMSNQANRMTRNLPSSIRAGGKVEVNYSLNLVSTLVAYAAEETLPMGWQPITISDGGFFDETNHKIKWGPFFNDLPQQLDFEASIPSEWQGKAAFNGFVSFDGLGSLIHGPSSLPVILNHDPIAIDDVVEWNIEDTLVLSIARLLANDQDANTDGLTFALESLVSQHGGALTHDGTTITYTPPDGNPVSDTFEYRIEDAFGGMDTATVFIQPLTAQQSRNILSIEIIAPGQVEVRFVGIPGVVYQVQFATQLNPPDWQTIPGSTQEARSDGTFEYVDVTEDTNRYYRSVLGIP